jgi:hypothetical protein
MTLVPIAVEKGTTAVVVLFAAGFALQLLGGTLLAVEIRNDLRAARRISAEVAWESLDTFPEFVQERLTRRLWPRVAGLALVLLGAAAGLVANLLALS